MTQTRKIFFGLMAVTGLILALAGLVWPAAINGPVPWLVWLLIPSLAFDLATFQFGHRLNLEPLDMNGRFIGVMIGAAIVLALTNVLPGAPGLTK